jgi:hypothetical protein
MRRVAAVFLVIALAGCLGSNGPSNDTIPDPEAPSDTSLRHTVGSPPGSVPAPTLEVMHLGVQAFEPSLGIDPDGRVYYRAASNPGSQDPGLMLAYDGQQWQELAPHIGGVSTIPISQDPFLHVDPVTGTIYALDLLGLACSTLNISDDGGETWTANPVGCGHPVGGQDQPSLTTAPSANGLLHPRSVHTCATRLIDAVCATSLDGGQTFGPLIPAFPAKPLLESNRLGYCGTPTGRVASGPDGTLLLPASRCGEPAVARSTDGGLTWTEHIIGASTTGHNDPEATFDADGRALATWTDEDGLGRLAVSPDGGASWDESFIVTAPGITAVDFLTVVSARPGEAVVAFMGTTATGGYIKDTNEDGTLDAVQANASWNGYLAFIQGLDQGGAQIVTVPVIPEGGLVSGQCGRHRCPGVWDFLDVQAGPDGTYWAAFVDASEAADSNEWEAVAVHLKPHRAV